MKNKIVAEDGYVFVCGDAYVTVIYLGENDSIDNYPLVKIDEIEYVEEGESDI